MNDHPMSKVSDMEITEDNSEEIDDIKVEVPDNNESSFCDTGLNHDPVESASNQRVQSDDLTDISQIMDKNKSFKAESIEETRSETLEKAPDQLTLKSDSSEHVDQEATVIEKELNIESPNVTSEDCISDDDDEEKDEIISLHYTQEFVDPDQENEQDITEDEKINVFTLKVFENVENAFQSMERHKIHWNRFNDFLKSTTMMLSEP
ncbi:unnamed protein product [Protopolystoma xenopodis]|uniref:Uncharacterized protein n=1 Tax=Protopolystoma xenopodis TaxID=117903 RepID=A0A3S5FC68_9PLAT|nr:unnamed protein product [Protopolystoma xenopodis]